jgi:hypothetical protein
MKAAIKILILTLLVISSVYIFDNNNYVIEQGAGCDAYIYISNNSLFEINLTIDGIGAGHLLVGKSKTYNVELINDAPKRIKVKVEYQDPDYIDPKAINYLTKGKLECGQSDTIYVAFSK